MSAPEVRISSVRSGIWVKFVDEFLLGEFVDEALFNKTPSSSIWLLRSRHVLRVRLQLLISGIRYDIRPAVERENATGIQLTVPELSTVIFVTAHAQQCHRCRNNPCMVMSIGRSVRRAFFNEEEGHGLLWRSVFE